jgi:sRNA-binding protein
MKNKEVTPEMLKEAAANAPFANEWDKEENQTKSGFKVTDERFPYCFTNEGEGLSINIAPILDTIDYNSPEEVVRALDYALNGLVSIWRDEGAKVTGRHVALHTMIKELRDAIAEGTEVFHFE